MQITIILKFQELDDKQETDFLERLTTETKSLHISEDRIRKHEKTLDIDVSGVPSKRVAALITFSKNCVRSLLNLDL